LSNIEFELMLIDMRYSFHEINDDPKLTDADKKQLKDFYLQNFIAPKARKILERKIAEEEARKQRMDHHPNRQ